MLRRIDRRGASDDHRRALDPPNSSADPAVIEVVRAVIAEVRAGGDAALRSLTQRFDGIDLEDVRVPTGELLRAPDEIDTDLRAALETAASAIHDYHARQMTPEPAPFVRGGVTVRDEIRPVDRAGLYAPGGRAQYPSTVLMTAIPARLAGVPEVVLCVPPDRNGNVAPSVLAAAAIADVDSVYRIGGAQAVAAMAYGTETIAPVDVIVGPGNAYVAAAKREVSGIVGMESMAGPSELVVIADEHADPEWIAVDLFAQAEHGPGGLAVVVSWNEAQLDAIDAAITTALEAEPRRDEITSTLRSGGRAVLVSEPHDAAAVSNAIAPEHLQIMTSDPEALVPLIRSAGAVFCGQYGSAVLGDYAVGTNHVLPTGGTARFSSALRVDNFRKHIHVVMIDETGMRAVGPVVETIAAVEGLSAHERAARVRRP